MKKRMIGRGTRLHPSKENVMVIDVVDVTRSHDLVNLATLFGLLPDDFLGRSVCMFF
jgi:superfamily II DNA or RNA helicase